LLASAALLAGCASAGGTAGIFDTGSVWYKHPTTGDVKECGGGFYPGAQIRRYNCGKGLQTWGYVEVEKCAKVPAHTECVTDGEISAAEAAEALAKGLPPAWVLWRSAFDSTGQRVPYHWSPIRSFDSHRECEAQRHRVITPPLLCVPDVVGAERLHHARVWLLWRPVLDVAGQPVPDQWSLVCAFDSRQSCEWEQRGLGLMTEQSLLCLPHTIDPRGPKGK
jgi:hypothetical protein